MSTGPVVAQVRGVRLSLGGAPLFDDVSLALCRGDRACLIGANGAGKSTLLRIIAGALEPDAGEVTLAGGAVVATVAQEPDLNAYPTLRAYVCDTAPAPLPAHAAEAALDAMDLDPDRSPQGLSGGEVRRAALAKAFAQEPDLLLLDEPTNHLDIPAILRLEERLARFSGAALIVSHDRRFLERVSTQCLWLRQRRVAKLEAGFSRFETWADEIEQAEATALARLQTQLKAEEHWLQRGVTARRSRNEGRRRKLMAMRAQAREGIAASRSQKASLAAEKGAESGRIVIEAKGLAKAVETPEGQRVLIRDVDLRLMRGARLGIIGANGAGKTTLIELLLGRRAPDAGTVRQGANLQIAYVDQARALLDPSRTIWQTLCPLGGDQVIVRGQPRHVAAYAADFLFTSNQLRQPAGALSGGERNRLALAVALAAPANLLVLDEPTNDLDMETLDVLEEMLAAYDGTVLIVSHDRAFLDGAATSVLGPLGGGRWVETPGGYDDFVREHGPPGGPDAPPKPTAKPAVSAPLAPTRGARKLSYKDARRLEELEAALPRLGDDIAALEARLTAPDAFSSDPAAFAALAQKLEQARARLDAAETEWLELEDRRAALTQGDG